MSNTTETFRSPAVGDFAVTMDWRYRVVGPLSAVTAKQVRYPSTWGGRGDERSAHNALLFWGSEAACKLLAQRLTSSSSLRASEHTASNGRHVDRSERAIRAAREQDAAGQEVVVSDDGALALHTAGEGGTQ